jgi:hypothetical protein
MKTFAPYQVVAPSFDLEFLRQHYSEEHPQFEKHFDWAAAELRKLLTLPLYSHGPIAAMSYKVDELWHTFILHTPQYIEFCEHAYHGRYLHHQPRSRAIPVPITAISNLYQEYPKAFGRVPTIWMEDIPPEHRDVVRGGEVPETVQQLRWSGWPGWHNNTLYK